MYREKVTVGAGTEYPLKGILTMPDGAAGKVPAVVMVHGSGASNMDEKVMRLTPFRDLADGLAKRGIASLRYDKRTFTHGRKMSKAMKKEDMTVREETIDDALLAIEMLRSDRRIGSIFILGHSMGAMLAPRIDAEGGDVRGIVMMAGTPYRLEDVLLRQLDQGREGNILVKAFVGLEKKIFEKPLAGISSMSDEEAKKKKIAGMPLYYFKEMGRKGAADYLLESDKPVLIMQGGMDFQVLVHDDFVRFTELLAGRENTEYRLYPILDHVFVPAIYDDILKAAKEYNVERHIGDDVIDDIAEFIRRHNGKRS